jgi:KEOPS complex subunit Cgi121
MKLIEDIPEIKIIGFKGNIDDVMTTLGHIDDISKNLPKGCTVQLLDAKGVAGREHVLHATIHALNAFRRDENIANDLGLEICVRASAQRQISRAIDILGLKKGPMDICAVLIGCPETAESDLDQIFIRNDVVLDVNELFLKEVYDIKNEEIELMGNIICTLMERTTILILDV